MKTIQRPFLVTLASVMLCGMPAMRAAETNPQAAEITKTAEAFVEAFQKGDAKAVAAFWTPDGDYVDENSRVLKGRKAIEDSFAELFAAKKGLKVRIDVASLRFPAPDLAIEIASKNDRFDALFAKALRYRRCGTKEVWIFSILTRQVFVYSDRPTVVLGEDDAFQSPQIPGFSIPISDLFAMI